MAEDAAISPTHDLQKYINTENMRWLWKDKISLIGSENTVQQKIQEDFIETYGEVDEIMAIVIFMIKCN